MGRQYLPFGQTRDEEARDIEAVNADTAGGEENGAGG
jgi:hypothetical protein